ncbi:MAG TPA: hypothetical protein VFG73_00320 [Rhodanobacteraceae bacterium]|nr:hypothetical protein [Rhodanobacteraceae bacterium]
MSLVVAQNPTGVQLLERIVDSDCNIVLLDVAKPGPVIEQLRQVVRRSGQALYLWQADSGLLSLREGDMVVPGAKRLTDALRFVRRSMHFGVYLIDGGAELLRPPDMALLMQIARLRDGPARRVVMMAPRLRVPANLESLCLRIGVAGDQAVRPRLRDGRWVR